MVLKRFLFSFFYFSSGGVHCLHHAPTMMPALMLAQCAAPGTCSVVRLSGVETWGSGGSMNRAPELLGAPPRVVGPQKFLGKNNIVLYVTMFACFIHCEKYCLHCVNCTKFDQLILMIPTA